MTWGCNCLCAVVHPGFRGICKGEATTTVLFSGPTGIQEVAMCEPCAEQARPKR